MDFSEVFCCIGSVIVKMVPCVSDKEDWSVELTLIIPPCASIIRLVMARPRPVPEDFLVIKGSKILSRSSEAILSPVLDMEMRS